MMNGELQECQLSLHHLSMVHFAVTLEILGDLKKTQNLLMTNIIEAPKHSCALVHSFIYVHIPFNLNVTAHVSLRERRGMWSEFC